MRWRWATKDPTHTLRVGGRVVRKGEVFDLHGPRPHPLCEPVDLPSPAPEPEPGPVAIEPQDEPEPAPAPTPTRRRRRRKVE